MGRRWFDLLTAAAAWALGGLSIGCVVAYLTVRINDSIRTFADAVVLDGWLALTYGLALAVVGVCAQGLAGRRRRSKPETRVVGWFTHVLASYTAFLVCVLGHWVAEALPVDFFWGRVVVMVAALVGAFIAALRVLRWRPPAAMANRVGGTVVAALIAVPLVPMYATTAGRTQVARATPDVKAAGSTRNVILIGIDGAEWNMIDPLIAAGRLPHLQRLRDRGVSAHLRTTIPTYSPIIWTTIATGVGESVHGVHDFTEMRIPGLSHGVQRFFKDPVLVPRHVGLHELASFLEGRGWVGVLPITSTQRRVKAVWNILSDQGRRVAVVNWFATWPAEPVNGYIVSDRNRAAFRDGRYQPLAGTAGMVYPPELKEQLEASLAATAVTIPPPEQYFSPSGNEVLSAPSARALSMFRDAYYADHFAASAAVDILRNHSVQFLAVYLSGVDVCSHLFLRRFPHLVPRYYEFIDGAVGRLMDAADADATLLIVSDHGWGFRPGETFSHFHAPDGVMILSGSGVAPGAHLAVKPSTLDITPTVLALMALPASKEMEGSVMQAALAPDVLAAAQIARIDSYGSYAAPSLGNLSLDHRSIAADARTVERLRMLGYMR